MRGFKVISLIALFVVAASSCSKKTSAPTTEKKKIDGMAVFSANCARCHGADGMTGRAPNLSQAKGAKADLVNTITMGHGHMPAFEDKLSKDEIDAVADWVLSIRK